MHGLTWHELVALGAPKKEGQREISRNRFEKKIIVKKLFFSEPNPLDCVEIWMALC
jgi:hypothetical protein